jgi:hypothetical protein
MKSDMSRLRALYAEASALKLAYESKIQQMKEAALAMVPFCEEATKIARAKHPEVAKRLADAYAEGEQLTQAMMLGQRWPKNEANLSKFSDILRAVPLHQRTPEMAKCLAAWEKYEAADKEWNDLNPPPELFRWNGSRLVGPNLYSRFGIAL